MMVMVGYRLMKISFNVINPVLLYVTYNDPYLL